MKFSEADLCSEFRAWMESSGYIVYPEVDTWDLVAVRDTKLTSSLAFKAWKHGEDLTSCQVGFQAKLRANIDVLYQAMSDATRGPELRMVLVPEASAAFIDIARKLGVGVVVKRTRRRFFGRTKTIDSSDGFTVYQTSQVWSSKPLHLPSISTNLVAGGPSPKQLTKWREKALGLCTLATKKGWLTSADFKAAKVDIKRWVATGWLRHIGEDGKLKKYVLGDSHPGVGWEEIAEKLEEKRLSDRKASDEQIQNLVKALEAGGTTNPNPGEHLTIEELHWPIRTGLLLTTEEKK